MKCWKTRGKELVDHAKVCQGTGRASYTLLQLQLPPTQLTNPFRFPARLQTDKGLTSLTPTPFPSFEDPTSCFPLSLGARHRSLGSRKGDSALLSSLYSKVQQICRARHPFITKMVSRASFARERGNLETKILRVGGEREEELVALSHRHQCFSDQILHFQATRVSSMSSEHKIGNASYILTNQGP